MGARVGRVASELPDGGWPRILERRPADRSKYFVIEADEYDTAYFDKGPKMWHYLPDTAIVNNIEFDHADIYRDEEAYKFAFARFINLIPKNGVLVAGWDSPIVRQLAPKSFAPVESFAYGDETPARDNALARAGVSSARVDDVPRVSLRRGMGRSRSLSPGIQRSECARCDRSGGVDQGDRDGVRKGLERSQRQRRWKSGRGARCRGDDDFAHHPTAVRETIDAVRQITRTENRGCSREGYTAQRREFQDDT